MNDKLLYRIPEVAEHLSISRSKFYELVKSAPLRNLRSDPILSEPKSIDHGNARHADV